MMRAQRGVILDAALLLAWAAAIGSLWLHERGLLGHGAVNPVTLLRAGLSVEDNEQWFGVYYQDQQVGYAHSLVIPTELDGMPGVQLVDQGEMAFTLLGQPQIIQVRANGFIDADWRLQRFTAGLQSGDYTLQWSGKRVGETLHIHVASGQGSADSQLYDPTGSAFPAGLVSWTAFHHLKEGQWGKFTLLNPLAVRPDEAFFYVRRSELVDGQRALVVETEFLGLTTTTWVTPEGEVLRESSPLGWEIRRIPREQAIHTTLDAPAVDLLTTTAVPLLAPLPPPARPPGPPGMAAGAGGADEGRAGEARTHMVWLLEGIRCADVPTTGVQRPLPEAMLRLSQMPKDPSCVVALDKPVLLAEPDAAASAAPHRRYLEPSFTVQSDDPRIAAQARAVIGEATDPWAQAQALNRWVYHTLSKRLTIGLPTALDVLVTKAGDCHEHTVLFAALARSLHIPTRLLAGLVAYEGRLFYHAWPEVWVSGRWIPLDPTLGQPVADTTHLALVEAENEQLVSLAQWIGRLSVRPLTSEEYTAHVP